MQKKGEHIHKRKDGRWEGRYRSGTDKNGRAVYRSVYGKSCGEVRKKLSQFIESSIEAAPPSNSRMLFGEVAALWQRANLSRCKGATAMKYDNLINKHILPELGGYRLSEINTFLLADFMNKKQLCGRIDRKGGLSPSYVRSIMLIVLEVIDFAADEGLCLPLRSKLRKPAVEKNEPEILDISTQSRLESMLSAEADETRAGILISLNAGLRISEVCALRWSDIDFQHAVLHVRSTVARVKSPEGDAGLTKLIIDRPKTKSSLRDIPISNRLMDVLSALYERRKSEYVISDRNGFVSPRTYEYRYHKVLEKCGIPSVNYHALRHTFATRCVELGVDVKTLSEILGHANVSVTLNTYVHSSMERKREQLEKLSCISAYHDSSGSKNGHVTEQMPILSGA